jgi:hypothetical protein
MVNWRTDAVVAGRKESCSFLQDGKGYARRGLIGKPCRQTDSAVPTNKQRAADQSLAARDCLQQLTSDLAHVH